MDAICSEGHTDSLLRQLNPNGSPSLFDYGINTSKTVLDLGCGAAYWAYRSAESWKDTRFTLVDVVDVRLEEFKNAGQDRIEFKQWDL